MPVFMNMYTVPRDFNSTVNLVDQQQTASTTWLSVTGGEFSFLRVNVVRLDFASLTLIIHLFSQFLNSYRLFFKCRDAVTRTSLPTDNMAVSSNTGYPQINYLSHFNGLWKGNWLRYVGGIWFYFKHIPHPSLFGCILIVVTLLFQNFRKFVVFSWRSNNINLFLGKYYKKRSKGYH